MKLCILKKSFFVLFCLFESWKEWDRNSSFQKIIQFAAEERKMAPQLPLGKWGLYQVLQENTPFPRSTIAPSSPPHPFSKLTPAPKISRVGKLTVPSVRIVVDWALSNGTTATADGVLHSTRCNVPVCLAEQCTSAPWWPPVTCANAWIRKEREGSFMF